MSGGLPPSTAVETTVGTLSPAEVYLTFTSGYCSLKASITAWNDLCSSPVQMPTTETLPETSLAALVEPPLVEAPPSSSFPPQPPSRATASAAPHEEGKMGALPGHEGAPSVGAS